MPGQLLFQNSAGCVSQGVADVLDPSNAHCRSFYHVRDHLRRLFYADRRTLVAPPPHKCAHRYGRCQGNRRGALSFRNDSWLSAPCSQSPDSEGCGSKRTPEGGGLAIAKLPHCYTVGGGAGRSRAAPLLRHHSINLNKK